MISTTLKSSEFHGPGLHPTTVTLKAQVSEFLEGTRYVVETQVSGHFPQVDGDAWDEARSMERLYRSVVERVHERYAALTH